MGGIDQRPDPGGKQDTPPQPGAPKAATETAEAKEHKGDNSGRPKLAELSEERADRQQAVIQDQEVSG